MTNLKTKPIIGIYTGSATDDLSPSFFKEYYLQAYAELFKSIINKGSSVVVVYDAENTYQGQAEFSKYWSVIKNESEDISYEFKNDKIKVDFLYAPKTFPYDDIEKINPRLIQEVCDDKYKTYLLASDMHAPTYLIENRDSLDVFLLSHRDKKIALKQLTSHAGKAVFVGVANDYQNNLQFPLIAQEFIDTSGGYENFVEGPHDVRVVLFNGDPIHGLLRQPPQDSLVSSTVSNGGKTRALFVDEIPAQVIEQAKKLDDKFNIDSPRLFSADFGYDGEQWKLFEANSSPALALESVDGPAAKEYIELLSSKLVMCARKD